MHAKLFENSPGKYPVVIMRCWEPIKSASARRRKRRESWKPMPAGLKACTVGKKFTALKNPHWNGRC
jgi:hypothetical protein